MLRARHIRHHRSRLLREKVERLLLQHARRPAHGPQDAHAEHGGVALLQFIHAPTHFVDPLDRIRDADRQQQRHQSELVAEIAPLARIAQVDRHHRAQLDAVDILALLLEIGADRACDRSEQHVVDRAAKRPADRLDVIERQRVIPGDHLRSRRRALQAGGRIVVHQCDAGQVLGHLRGDARHSARRCAHRFRLFQHRRRRLQGSRRCIAGGSNRFHRRGGQRAQEVAHQAG